MVIFISGSINSGKTTTAKALAQKLGAQFIDIDDVNDRVPNFNLATDIPKGIALAIEDINNLTAEGKSVTVSYPISEKNRQQIIEGLHDRNPQFITLAPRLEVAQSKRGDRVLTEWEVARIKHHYDTGIATPTFGKIIDNSEMSIDETVSAIEELAKQ
jgi:adenylate kinase family enzyme